jgi:hypothetical protein
VPENAAKDKDRLPDFNKIKEAGKKNRGGDDDGI